MFDFIVNLSRAIIACMLAVIVFTIVKKRLPKNSKLLKYTRNSSNIHGIVFGRKGHRYAYSPSAAEGHIFVGGGSGTGKTSSLLIPALRCFEGTTLSIDISGDIIHNVDCPNKMVYAPGASTSIPFNIFAPIDALETDSDRVEALAQLAWLLMPQMKNSSANSDYFQDGGRAILTAALICGYHLGLDFVQICVWLVESSFADLFRTIDASGDSTAIKFINQFEGNSEQSTAGCMQNADRAVALFATNENVKRSIRRPAADEISFNCISVEKNNVFVRIPDSKLELMAPLLRIIVSQTLNYLADRPENNVTPILLALDEFASLGHIEIGPALRKLRKKHVRIMVLTQSMADLDEVYGREARMTMMNNFAFKVILSASDTDSQRYYANLIGQEEKEKVSETFDGFYGFYGIKALTKTKTNELRYIVEPATLANLGKNLILLYPDGDGHCVLRKVPFYEN